MRIGDYIYYRRFDNPADAITLYRFALDEAKARGLNEGEVPNLRLSDDETLRKSETLEEFPEDIIFSLHDLKELYSAFAHLDLRIKDFVERITDFVVTQEHQPLHSFQISD